MTRTMSGEGGDSRVVAAPPAVRVVVGSRETESSVVVEETTSRRRHGRTAASEAASNLSLMLAEGNDRKVSGAGGVEQLCMIVDRFETDVRKVSRGSALLPTDPGMKPASSLSSLTSSPMRKASHQPRRPRHHLSLAAAESRQRSHNDLLLLSPTSAKSTVSSFVDSVRKSSFSSKMAEILDGDFHGSGGGARSRASSGIAADLSVSVAAAAAVSEAAATVVKCSVSEDASKSGGSNEDELMEEVSWRLVSGLEVVAGSSATVTSSVLSESSRSPAPVSVGQADRSCILRLRQRPREPSVVVRRNPRGRRHSHSRFRYLDFLSLAISFASSSPFLWSLAAAPFGSVRGQIR